MQISARLLPARILLAAATLALAQPAAAAVSPAVGKALQAAAKAAGAGNSAAAIAAINQAKGAASTSEEKLKTAQMAGYVFTRAGRYADAARELESAGAPAGQLAPLYYRAGQYDKAIALAKSAGGEQNQILVAQAYTRQGKHAQAVAAYNALIKSNGAKPLYLENLAGAQFKAGDKKGYMATTTRLVKIDGSPARWKTLLSDMQGTNMRSEAKLALLHLMNATGNLTRKEDVHEFAKLALIAGQAAPAKEALAKLGPATDTIDKKLEEAANKAAAREGAEAAKLSASPTTAVKGGNAWFGVGQYAKAVAAYDSAIKAAGKDVDQAQLFKGIAALKGGNAAAANAAFAAVTDKSGLKDVSNLWALYASSARR
jgi:tetratricopeptide (TPR) repeat protein